MNIAEKTHHVEALFADWHKLPLTWGQWDCAQLCADFAHRLTGANPIADWPKYVDDKQARKAIRAMGFKRLSDAVSSYATPLQGPLFAMVGDIVAIEGRLKSLPALGVCLGPDAVLCFWGEDGQPRTCRRFDMQYAIAAWRVV